jgi:hypothetical protein
MSDGPNKKAVYFGLSPVPLQTPLLFRNANRNRRLGVGLSTILTPGKQPASWVLSFRYLPFVNYYAGFLSYSPRLLILHFACAAATSSPLLSVICLPSSQYL